MILFIIACAFWLGCAIIHHGLWFSSFQDDFPRIANEQYWDDLLESIVVSLLFGPVGLLGFMDEMSVEKIKRWRLY